MYTLTLILLLNTFLGISTGTQQIDKSQNQVER